MKRLPEVDIIRAISMIFIVLLHSFALYTGAWEYPGVENFSIIYPYRIFTRMLTSLSLPTFVFISGYLFSHTSIRKKQDISQLAIDKFKRLIIPSLVFGLIYIPLFFSELNLFQKAVKLFNGAGHLWFLPMLFWNFIFGFYLKKHELQNKAHKALLLLLLFCIAIVGPILTPNIFGFSKALGYVPYFYMGIEAYNYRDEIVSKLNIKHLIGIIVLYIVVFTINEFILYHINSLPTSIYSKVYIVSYRHILSIGIAMFFLSTISHIRNKELRLNGEFNGGGGYINMLARYSFGIYIYHQFILMFMIYKLHIHEYIDYRIAPLVFFTISFTTSLALSKLTLKTRVGRYLIG